MLFSAPACSLMTTANDLIVVFLALEILSIPLYVLAAFDRRRLSSQEAGIKYFVLGAFSSAIFLYGIALVYGATGTTSLTGIADFLAQNTLFEQGTLLAGFGAAARRPRVQGGGGAVPHVDARRVPGRARRRSPRSWRRPRRPPAFAALLRVFTVAFPHVPRRLAPGGLGARRAHARASAASARCVQTDLKRLLAYSSIAHAGYVLMASRPATAQGPRGGALLPLRLHVHGHRLVRGRHRAEPPGRRRPPIDGYRGLASRRPVLGSLLVFFMLAQAGIPLTGGFIAKLEVFAAAADAGEYAARRDRRGRHRRRRVRVPAGRARGRTPPTPTARSPTGCQRPSRRRRHLDRARVTAGVTLVLGIVPAVVRALGPGRHVLSLSS